MKLGLFDSGLGGLLLARAIREKIPDVDMIYLGDTLHVPYGKRSDRAVYNYTKRGVNYLFHKDCQIVILACNTASAAALRQLQQIFLPKYFSRRRILGVIVPTLEEALDQGTKKLGILGTSNTIHGKTYDYELSKLNPSIEIVSKASPLLVPLIEDNGEKYVSAILQDYLSPLIDENIDTLLLGCTHYPSIKPQIREILPSNINILSQDEFIPQKVENYLRRHEFMASKLSRKGGCEFLVTDLTDNYIRAANKLYGENIDLRRVELPDECDEDDFIPDLEKKTAAI